MTTARRLLVLLLTLTVLYLALVFARFDHHMVLAWSTYTITAFVGVAWIHAPRPTNRPSRKEQ